jgi:hypothetical protein
MAKVWWPAPHLRQFSNPIFAEIQSFRHWHDHCYSLLETSQQGDAE